MTATIRTTSTHSITATIEDVSLLFENDSCGFADAIDWLASEGATEIDYSLATPNGGTITGRIEVSGRAEGSASCGW